MNKNHHLLGGLNIGKFGPFIDFIEDKHDLVGGDWNMAGF